MDNHQLALKVAGILILGFQKRGDIEGTFDPNEIARPIEDAILEAIQHEREACASVVQYYPCSMFCHSLGISKDHVTARDYEIAEAIRERVS